MRTSLCALAALLAAGCGHSSPSQPDAAAFTGRPGDLGASSPVIDHSGPNGGLAGALQSGAIGDTWQPAGCPGTVPVAQGVTGAAWGTDSYGATDKSPHGVHTSFRFDPSSSFAAIWETDADTKATFVAYGDSPTKLDHFVQGVTFANPPDPIDHLDYPLLVHEVHVCGLQPDHTYYFAVGGDGWYGNVYPITTGPTIGSAQAFRFIAMGDSNFFYSLYAQLQATVSAYSPAFTLFTGDMIHQGTYQSDWEQWFAAGGPTLASVPTMTVHGNHEEMAVDYFALFALPGGEEIYSFDFGNVHFVVLNDSPTAGDTDLTGRQASFLDADLTAAEQRPVPPTWIVTSHHRPMFSSDPQQGSFLNVRGAWQSLFEKHHVDVDFNGHSHHYESTLPILGDGGIVAPDAGGIRYLTVGGAGALYDPPTPTPNPWTLVYYAGLSLAVIDVTAHTFTIQGYKADGSLLESAPIVLQK
ncbi:MAG TPA: metallophosphoesterase family protein [Polyangiaceae bacterium]|nr:metallophosphoesterase family protein [Polyangiaceae bacterium]